MSDFLIAQIRTWVPALAGAVIAFLVSIGLLDEETSNEALVALTTFGTALFTGLYYFVVRWLAERWPWVGNLLGVNIAPEYNGE